LGAAGGGNLTEATVQLSPLSPSSTVGAVDEWFNILVLA